MGVNTTIAVICLILLTGGLGLGLFEYSARALRWEREQSIRALVFSAQMLAKLSERHAHLVEKHHFLVAHALREFFLIHARTKPRQSMRGRQSGDAAGGGSDGGCGGD